MMTKAALAALVAGTFLSAVPTYATEWVYCGDEQANVEIGFLLGTVDAFMPAGATMRHKTQHWTTSEAYGDGAIMTVGQGFSDHTMLLVDLYDEAVSGAIAELRLWKAEEGETSVHSGILRIPGQGVWAVTCDLN
jgi:hypothetical protein